MVFESCGEMSLVDIAYTVGYLRDVYLALAQQTRGLLHAQIAEELSRRDARHLLHLAVQLGTADADVGGQHVDVVFSV